MKKQSVIAAGALLILLVPALCSASTLTISSALPGPVGAAATSASSPGVWVQSIYLYALFISGLLAFGAIIYGGLKYATSRGNPSAESDARQWIWSALLGIVLLAGAYLILYTVNPNIVSLSLPNLQTIAPPGAGSGMNLQTLSNGQTCTQGSAGMSCLPAGQSIQTLGNGQTCLQTSAGLSCLPSGGTPTILPNGQLCSQGSSGLTCCHQTSSGISCS